MVVCLPLFMTIGLGVISIFEIHVVCFALIRNMFSAVAAVQ